MMHLFQIFMVGLIFSFLGSIPPGTINLSVMQLGLKKQMQGALLFTLAAVLVEFVCVCICSSEISDLSYHQYLSH